MSRLDPAGFAAGSSVAVIVTVYNKAPYVRDCLESVMRQTHPCLEVVIVDDGSTDGSWEVIESAAEHSGARLLRLANGGVSRARNLGFHACRSKPDYLLFLDGDDVLLPSALCDMVAHMERHDAASMCYTVPQLIDASGNVLGIDTDQVRWAATPAGRRLIREDELDTPLEAIWAHFRAIPSSCLIRRATYERTRGWDDSLCRPARPFQVEDKDMAIQLALLGPVHRLPVTTLQYRVLPTAHRNSLFEGLLAVDRKWWNAALDAQTRRKVRYAIRFDSRVVLLDAVAELLAALHAWAPRRVLAAGDSVVHALGRFIFLPLRLRTHH